MPSTLSRSTLGLAAEYAVASELCRRGIYAQLTFGNQKKTDILVFSPSGKVARIEVKSKQGSDWPNCKGIADPKAFLVFVDYQGRELDASPDFFVLSERDWRSVLEKRVAEERARNPKRKIKIAPENYCIFVDQIGPSGKPYTGIGIKATHLTGYRGRWETIARRITAG
jgi:hypothetical protein